MNELLYDKPSVLIVGVLLALMALAVELGHRYGIPLSSRTSDATKAQVASVASGMLSILALMIGFTFSISVQRYESRSEAVVDEANAIGTAYLRVDLLPQAVQPHIRKVLSEYASLRASESQGTSDNEATGHLLASAEKDQAELWKDAGEGARLEPNPVTTGLFIQALNEMIDSYGRHNAALKRHVPEIVIFMLFGVFIATAGIIGFSAGVGGSRPLWVSYVLVTVVALLVFIILDIDRPRRGLIRVSNDSMNDLCKSIDSVKSIDGRLRD